MIYKVICQALSSPPYFGRKNGLVRDTAIVANRKMQWAPRVDFRRFRRIISKLFNA